MDKQELEQLRQRLDLADDVEARVNRLAGALKDIDTGHVQGVKVTWRQDEGEDLQFIPGDVTTDNPWRPVCWAASEEGLIDDLRKAIREVVARRHAEATAEFGRL